MQRCHHTSRITALALTASLALPAPTMALSLPAGAIPQNPAGAAARQAEAARRAAIATELQAFGFTLSESGVAAAAGTRNYIVLETGPAGRLRGGDWHRWRGALLMPDPARAGMAAQVSMRLSKLLSRRFYGFQSEGNELTQFLTDVTGRVVGTQSVTWTGRAVTQFDPDGDGIADLVEVVNPETFEVLLVAQEGAGVSLADSLLNGDNPFCQQTRGGTVMADRAAGADARALISACPTTPRTVGSSVPATGGSGTRRHSVGAWYQDPLGQVCDGVDTVRAQFMAESGPDALLPLVIAAGAALAAATGYAAYKLAEAVVDLDERMNQGTPEQQEELWGDDASGGNESPGICDDGSRGCGDMGLLGLCVARREAAARHPVAVLTRLMSESQCINPAEANAGAAPAPGDVEALVDCVAREEERPNLDNLQGLIAEISSGGQCSAEEGRECDDLPMSSHRTQSGRYWTSLQSILGFDLCDPRICDPIE